MNIQIRIKIVKLHQEIKTLHVQREALRASRILN